MTRRETRQILFRQLKEFDRRPQPAAVFRVRRVLEILLQMNKRAGCLDQPLKKIIVRRVGVEPNLLQHIVRFVITLLIPATKIGAVKRMIRHLVAKIDIVAFELADELRNPLAFIHEALNFHMPQMMGKPTFPEGHESSPRRVRPLADVRDRSQE